MRQSLEQLAADTWRKNNPAGLSDRQAANAATLAVAEITILSADRNSLPQSGFKDHEVFAGGLR